MAMTPVEMDRMSLADLEVAADRFRKALEVLHEARALMGNAPLTANVPAQARTPGPADLSPVEQAERARLLKGIRGEDMPDDIRRQMEGA
jgi:hypothetical protein